MRPYGFRLYFKGTKNLASFNVVDAQVARALGMPYHPYYYCCDWPDSIGLLLGAGLGWDKITQAFSGTEVGKVANFMARQYDVERF